MPPLQNTQTTPNNNVGTQGAPVAERIRTFKSDVADAVQNKNISVVSIAVAEEKKRVRENANTDVPDAPKIITTKRIIIGASILFVLAGLVAMGYAVVSLIKNAPTQTPITRNEPTLISTEFSTVVPITPKDGAKMLAEIKKIRTNEHGLGTIDALRFAVSEPIGEKGALVTRELKSTEFVEGLVIAMPPALLRSLSPRFMLGIHNISSGNVFIIFTPEYFESTFATMLEWEKTMFDSIGPVFGYPKKDTGPSNNVWSDVIVKNTDARILKNESGTVVLAYAFANRNRLVIAPDTETLKEVLTRISESVRITR